MEWNNEDALLLIQVYEKYPLLWNPKHALHFNKIRKAEAWDEITKECDVDVEEVRKKMASLLGLFRREKAKGKKTIGTGKAAREVYKTNWFAFKSLLFVIDRDDPRSTLNSENTSNDNDDLDETQDISMDIPDHTGSEYPSQQEINIVQPSKKRPAESSSFMKPAEPKHKRVKKQVHAEDPRIEQAFQFLQQPRQEDPTMIFAQYVVNKLKQFEGRTRALVEHGINQLLFEAEIGKYDSIPPQTFPNNISTHSLSNQTPLTIQQPELISPSSYSSHSSSWSALLVN